MSPAQTVQFGDEQGEQALLLSLFTNFPDSQVVHTPEEPSHSVQP